MRPFWSRRRDVDDEIASHMEEKTAELIESGLSPREARLRARREFGNLGLIGENARSVWGWLWFERLAQDLRYAVRMLVRTPTFTAVAVLSLALGIGANTAIFGLLDMILFRMLPIETPEELKIVNVRWQPGRKPESSLTHPCYRTLRDGNRTFRDLAAYSSFTWRDRSAAADGAWHSGQIVSGNFFDVLGVRASVGRALTPADDAVEGTGRADAIPAVLSYSYWRRAFHRDPGVLGRAINVNGAWATVVGVAAPDFFGMTVGSSPDVFVPLLAQPSVMPMGNLLHDTPTNSTNWLTVVGRLAPGVSEEEARADLAIAAARYGVTRLSPEERKKPLPLTIEFEPGGRGLSRLRDRFSEPLQVLMALVGVVLLIACANLANLLLARTAARRREISVRLAIGAPRGRIIRQLITESLLLAMLGGAAGLAFAIWSSGLLVQMLPRTQVPLALSLAPDARLLAFTLALSTFTVLLFGVAPALRATRLDVHCTLQQVRAGSFRRPRFDLSRALVVAQIALAAPLVVGAGLFIGTVRNLVTQEAGFQSRNVIQVQIAAGAAGIPRAEWASVYDQVLDRIKSVPGVRAASLTNRGLMEEGLTRSGPLGIPGYTFRSGEPRQLPETYVGPEYFAASGIPLRLGRFFNSVEEKGTSAVAIVNETMAQRYFPGRNPIGSSYSLGSNPPNWITIVGVVADAKYSSLRESDVPMAYYPWRQVGTPGLNSVIVRADGDAATLLRSLQRSVASVHPELFRQARTLASQIDETLVRERILARLSSFLGVLALLVACVGLYGVLSYRISRRTSEIGVRVALGASPSAVASMVFRETAALIALGIAIGTALALAICRLVRSFLFGLEPDDPFVIAGSVASLVAVGLLAAWLPARRAARVDPLIALRHD